MNKNKKKGVKMTNDEIITKIVTRHFKRLESFLLDLNLPRLAYVSISKEFHFLEKDLKDALSFQEEDLNSLLTEEK